MSDSRKFTLILSYLSSIMISLDKRDPYFLPKLDRLNEIFQSIESFRRDWSFGKCYNIENPSLLMLNTYLKIKYNEDK